MRKKKTTACPDYINTLKEKRKMLELEELFNKFDDDDSGTLDMSELF
jgi:Ca2+-binding EF-hand superfamily protein